MKRVVLLAFFVALMLSCLDTNAHATIVYDNTANIGTAFYPSLYASENGTGIELGDQITLAGTERIVTEFQIPIYLNTLNSGTADGLIHFYRNDGLGGAPGTVLWNSGVFNDLPHTSGINTYIFGVPSILVPDTFIWTVQLSDRKGSTGSIGPILYDPPTVGSSGDFIWSFFDSTWHNINDPGLVDNLGARVSAVSAIPEPTTMLLIGSGLLGLAGYGRKKFKK